MQQQQADFCPCQTAWTHVIVYKAHTCILSWMHFVLHAFCTACILYRMLMEHVISCCFPCNLLRNTLQAGHLPSRFTGVSWSVLLNRWAVYLMIPADQAGNPKNTKKQAGHGRTCLFLGCFDTDEEAAKVADKGRIRYVRLQLYSFHFINYSLGCGAS